MNNDVYLYDGVVPVDVSVIHGETAAEENFRKFKFSHQYRLLVHPKSVPFRKFDEINNNHTVPVSENILRALKIFKIGEPVYIEGLLSEFHN